MKRRLIIAAPILLAVALAFVIYERRNTIARDLANRALGETQLRVADVELDTLGPRRVRFSALELETAGGVQVTLLDLEVPLEFPSVTPEYVSIGRVQISTTDAATDERTALTPRLQTVLDLSARFPTTAVTVQALQVDTWPVIRDAVWNLAPRLQRLTFTVESFTMSAELDASDSSGYQLQANIATEARPDAATITTYIETQARESQLRGYVETDGETVLAAGALFDVIPDGLRALSGQLVGMLDVVLDREAPGTASILAAAASEGDLEVSAFDRTVRGSISTNSPVELRTTWPGEDWQLRAPRSAWFADIAGVEQMPIKLSNASCEPGLSCELDVELGPASVKVGALSIDRLQATLPLAIDYKQTMTARLVTAPTWRLTGVRLGSATIGAVIGIGLDDAAAGFSAGAYTGSARRMSASMSNIVLQKYQVDALAIAATDIAFGENGLTATLRVPESSGRIAWRDYRVRLPAFDAELAASGQRIDLTLQALLDDGAGTMSGVLAHRLDDHTGSLTIDDASVDLGRLALDRLVSGLPAPLRVIAGELSTTGTATWSQESDGTQVETRLRIDVADVAASWNDIGAAGIAGHADALLTSEGVRFDNGTGTAELVDVGTPIENLRADFSMPTPQRVDVSGLTFGMLGGSFAASPFSYDLETGATDVDLELTSIQLPFMAEMTGLESIRVEGSLSGNVPLRIEGNAVAGGSGVLTNDPPGGVIRVDAGTAATLAGNAGVEYATRALDNFVFESLSSDVEYRPDGDLVLSMRLEGVNPGIDPDQPIILNLGIENNVPQLLRSLQALRSIEDMLEARIGTRE